MSRIEVAMPQMGESIAEGTVSKWLKQLGDPVERDEPILEISTDKVDAEIPSPSAGTLTEILVAEGETVEVGTPVAFIDPGAGASQSASPVPETQTASPSREALEPEAVPPKSGGHPAPAPASPNRGGEDPEALEAARPATSEERLRTRSTPVVRRIAEEAGVDISRVPGTGHLGRVTKGDILAYIESRRAASAPTGAPDPTSAPDPIAVPGSTSVAESPPPAPFEPPVGEAGVPAVAEANFWERFLVEVRHPVFPVRKGDRVERMDKVRRLTAEHMVLAKRISTHVHSVIEIDFSAVDRIRRASRSRWVEQGARVSYTAFVAWACSRILRDFPGINGTISGDNVIYRGAVNIGMAVDLNPGLIVPVIHDADHLSLVGIGRKIIDLATRAKSRALSPREIQGATFTITNPGVLGTIVGMPIIPKGTSAILGTGSIEKRVVVVADSETGDDLMAIRKRSYFSLGYDHRLVDGADSARFLSRLKELLEDFPGKA